MKITTSLSLACLAASLCSCKIPPNLTWQNVQDQGLIPVISKAQTSSTVNADMANVEAPKIEMAPSNAAATPTADAVPGRPGYVYSPFTTPRRVVDVRDFKAGEEVRCPITFKSFVVPTQAAAAASTSADKSATPSPSAHVTTKPMRHNESKPTPPKQEAAPAPVSTPSPTPAPVSAKNGEMPTAKWVPNRPGFVFSPFATKFQLVDVAGVSPGVEVRCPYTGKLFKVPAADAPAGEPISAPNPADKPKETPAPQEMKKEKEADKPKEAPKPTPTAAPQDKPKETPKADAPKADAPKADAPKADAPKPEAKPEAAKTEMKKDAPAGNAQAGESLPTAAWSDKDKSLVQSPYGQPGQLVDVSGKSSGAKVVCPFTGKTFVVPGK